MARISISSINEELALTGWSCVSEKYENLDTQLHFKCDEGHDVYSTWKKIRSRRDCPTCASNEYANVDMKVVPKRGKQRVMAFDQSSHISGWCVIDDGQLVSYGKFAAGAGDEAERLNKIRMWFCSMATSWKPDYIGFEGIQYQATSEGDKSKIMGVTVFQTLARVQGVLMEAAFGLKIPFEVIPTNTWRAHVGVKGRTRTDKKMSMKLLIKKWYDISVVDDIADAIGIGKYLADHAIKAISTEQWD